MELTSPAFADGDPIPRKYGYSEENVNPPLEISDAPDSAETLLLIVDDPDAREPAGKIWDHWIVWNVDAGVDEIPEDWDADAVEGETDYGETGWGGPNPPDREHTYRFILYALDTTLDVPAGATKDDAYDAAEGHVVEKAQLEGTYEP